MIPLYYLCINFFGVIVIIERQMTPVLISNTPGWACTAIRSFVLFLEYGLSGCCQAPVYLIPYRACEKSKS